MAARDWDPRGPRPAGAWKIIHGYLEANNQSFKAGSPVYFNAGAVTASVGGTTPVAGFAMVAGTNVSSGNIEIPVMVPLADSELYIQVSSGGTLEATADTTCTPGVAYDMVLDSNSEYATLDSADTTNPVFVFIEAVKDVNGDSTTWAKCRPYYLENQMIAG